jgi:hypothetical protein
MKRLRKLLQAEFCRVTLVDLRFACFLFERTHVTMLTTLGVAKELCGQRGLIDRTQTLAIL